MPNARRLLVGETANAFGTSVSAVAIPLVATLSLNSTALQISVLVAATWLPWLLIGLLAGAWVDRLQAANLMIACDLMSFVATMSIPLAAAFGALSYAHLLLVALVLGVSSVFFQTAFHVLIPQVVRGPQLISANGALQGAEAAAEVGGPAVAGGIAQAVGAVAGLVLDAATFLISAACLNRIRREKSDPPQKSAPVGAPRSLWVDIRLGLRYVWQDTHLRTFTIYGAAANLALTGYQSLLVVFLIRDVGVGPGQAGLLLGGLGAGGVLGAVAARRIGERFGSARGFLLSHCCCAPFALVIPLTQQGWRQVLIVIGGLIVVAGVVCGNVIKDSWRQLAVPNDMLGRTIVTMQFLNYGMIPLGAVTAGALATSLGTRSAIWLMASALTLALLVLLLSPLRRERDLPAHLPGAGSHADGGRLGSL